MPVATNEIKGWPQGPGTYGEAAIIMEAGTGAILYGKNIDDQHYPASITKVLTALVALENGKMDDKVTFTHDCVSFLQPGDSSIGMKENDEIMISSSANTAETGLTPPDKAFPKITFLVAESGSHFKSIFSWRDIPESYLLFSLGVIPYIFQPFHHIGKFHLRVLCIVQYIERNFEGVFIVWQCNFAGSLR